MLDRFASMGIEAVEVGAAGPEWLRRIVPVPNW